MTTAIDGEEFHVPPDEEFHVPPDEEPPVRCRYCDRQFRSERHELLHLGVDHDDEWTDEESDRYEEAFEEETHDLFTLHVLLVIFVLLGYFFFAYLYIIVWL